MERRVLWIVAAAVAVLIVVPVILLVPAIVQGWRSSRPIVTRPPRPRNPSPTPQTQTKKPYVPFQVTVNSKGEVTEITGPPPLPNKLTSDFEPEGPSILVCAPAPVSNDADTKAFSMGLWRVLHWKLTNLQPLYAQLPDRYTALSAQQLHIAYPRSVSREQALRLADHAGHNFAVYGTISRTGNAYSAVFKVLDVTHQKDIGEPIKLEGNPTELLQREGAAALEIAQRMNLKLRDTEEKWLQSPVSSNPETLRVVSRMPSMSHVHLHEESAMCRCRTVCPFSTSYLPEPADEAAMKRLAQVAPDWALAAIGSIALGYRKQRESATKRAQALAEKFPDVPAVRLFYVDLLLRNDQYDEAEKELDAMPKTISQSYRGIFWRQMHHHYWQCAHSVEYMRECQRLNPRIPYEYLSMSSSPDPKRLEEIWKQLSSDKLKLGFDQTMNVARAYVMVGQQDRAHQLMQKVLKTISASYTDSYARQFLIIKAYPKELMMYEEELRRERHPRSLAKAAQCCYRMGQIDRAQTLWEEIINMDKKKSLSWQNEAFLGRALCHMKKGQQDRAVADYAAATGRQTGMERMYDAWLENGEWTPAMFETLDRIVKAAGGEGIGKVSVAVRGPGGRE